MKHAWLFALLVVFSMMSCSTEKHKAATQNNKLVAIHGEVIKAIKELDAAKKDNAKFVAQLENTIKAVQNQSKELSEVQVVSKLQDIKNLLESSLAELHKGYGEVLELYKSEKFAEAKTKLETVEKGFQDATRRLQELQAQVARSYDIPIKAAAEPATEPAGDMPADMPAEPAVDMPAADMPSEPAVDMPAADMPSEPAGDMPAGDMPAGDMPSEPAGDMPSEPAVDMPAGDMPSEPR